MAKKNEKASGQGKRRLGWVLTPLICLVILLLAGGVTYVIFTTEPEATRESASIETAMLVEVTEAKRGTFRPEILAMGTVAPAQDITLSPRVSGEIVERADSFVPGGFIDKGQTVLKIDPSDFENTLQQRESDLRRAIAALEVEMGRQNVAKQGYELLDENLSDENEALVLRKPQLNTARADVEAARAAVNQAELELERTKIKAPFDAHVLRRDVNVGSQVTPSTSLGRLVGVDRYWVEVTVPLSKLHRLSFPGVGGEEGSPVRVRNRSAWPEGVYREGRLFQLVGELEDRTRLAKVLVTVEDPLSRQTDRPRLIVGSFVETFIQVKEIPDVIRLKRDYVHKNDTVWVMKEGELDIREVKIIFEDREYAYIESGLEEGERVVTTNLSTVAQGAKLRLQSPENGARDSGESNDG